MNPSIQKIEISWATLWRIFFFFAAIALVYFAWGSFTVLLVGVVISLGIDPFVSFIAERLKLGRVFAAIIVVLSLILIFVGAIYLVTPVIFDELSGFLTHFTQSISSILRLELPGIGLKDLGLNQVLNFLAGASASVPMAITRILGNILLLFSSVIITLYLSIEKDGAEKMIRLILPDAYERPVMAIFTAFKIKMRRWLATQFIFSLFMGVTVGLGMWLMGVRYALILGILAAIFGVVPIIGPVVTGAVAFLIAMTDSTILAIYALIFFFVVQQFENHVLTPLVMGKSMQVHPVIVVISLLAGGQIAGFVGIVLGVPLAVLVQEIFNYLAERKERHPMFDM